MTADKDAQIRHANVQLNEFCTFFDQLRADFKDRGDACCSEELEAFLIYLDGIGERCFLNGNAWNRATLVSMGTD